MLRIVRRKDVNDVAELDRHKARKIAADPLMKSSAVLSGVFHRRVFIVESEADSMFYSALLDLPSVHEGQQPDVLFVHSNGNDRMGTLVEALANLKVWVDVIADMDLLRIDYRLKSLVQAFGGDWSEVEPLANSIAQAIERNKSSPEAQEVVRSIEDILRRAPLTGAFPKESRNAIKKVLTESASCWKAIKRHGRSQLPGEQIEKYIKMEQILSGIGLWLAPVGELEGFCKSIGGHGSKWVQQVVNQRDLAGDGELAEAREFVKGVWSRPPPQ